MDASTDQVARRRSYRPADGLRVLFIGILGLWVLFPVLVTGNLAQDAVPYLVAGELARTDVDAVYAPNARDLYDLPPVFAARSCEISPPGTDCRNLNVAFVSPPPAIPFAIALARLGPGAGALALRLLAAASLAGGMWTLWGRLSDRTPRAAGMLVATALLLTPFTMVPIPLGQTSPLLFLSACLGISAADRRRSWAAGIAGLWILISVLKLFPVALVLVLLWRRRFRLLGWAAAWLAAWFLAAAAVVPLSTYGRFVEASRVLSGYALADRYNLSWDAAVHGVAPGLGGGIGMVISVAVRLVAVAFLARFVMRRADEDAQWAWAWLALLLFVPLVWWHYLWVAVAAVAIALSSCRRLDDRLLAVLPAMAALTIPLVALDGRGGVVALVQLAVLVAGVLGVPLLLVRGGGVAAGPASPSQ